MHSFPVWLSVRTNRNHAMAFASVSLHSVEVNIQWKSYFRTETGILIFRSCEINHYKYRQDRNCLLSASSRLFKANAPLYSFLPFDVISYLITCHSREPMTRS